MDQTTHITQLLVKYNNQNLTKEEWAELQKWAVSDPAFTKVLADFNPNVNKGEFSRIMKDYNKAGEGLHFESVYDKIHAPKRSYKSRKVQWLGWAASILILLSFAIYNFKEYQYTIEGLFSKNERLILPGTTAAIIQTNKGTRYSLTNLQSIKIDANGRINLSSDQHEIILDKEEELTLIVPKGNEFSFTMADGTQVWLNSNSKLRFPRQFNEKERIVYLEGEAFFDVMHLANKPFIVQNKKQNVLVLGTTFNVKCYPEDSQVITTLFQGKVAVEDKIHHTNIELVPGEVSNTSPNNPIKKMKANLNEVKAWRNGLFSFNNTPFEEVIKQVARWYNVEVIYQKGIPKELFTGEVSRDVDFSVMVQFLQGSGINLIINNGKLIIN